jgi:hypothetical protein
MARMLFKGLLAFVCCSIVALEYPARADTITAEEIEVPAPEWSVFFEAEEPTLPRLLDELPEEIAETPRAPEREEQRSASSVVPIPLNRCWFFDCGGDGGRRRTPRIPTAPIPEPTAGLLFLAGLLVLAKAR